LLLTATVSSTHIEAIRKTLNIEKANFEIIQSTNLLYQEIRYEVVSKKERKDTIIGEMAEMIRTIEDGKSIIYCARKKDCEEIRDILQTKLPNYLLDIYHGGLDSKDKKHVLEKWEENKTYTIIATTAFGMGLNIPDVRLILHYTFLTTLIELIQLSGRAGHDGKPAKDVIFFGLKDLRTNYSIIAKDQRYNNIYYKLYILNIQNYINYI
ncbi:P-loop containing nucleoside triphosphate hydrolase protein, partial [Gigaspora rosea]